MSEDNHTTKGKPTQLTLYDVNHYTYQAGNKEAEVVLEDNDMWASQKDMSQMFGVSVPTINYHIKAVMEDDHLDGSTIREILIVATDGKQRKVSYYNLDVVLPVGYRVNSEQASKFRKWANGILRDYLTKGIVVNPDSPKVRRYKRQLEIMGKVWNDNEDGIRHITLTLALIDSLKVVNTMAKQVVISPNYGRLMNAEYLNLFGMTASGLKTILKGNVREALGNEAMATLLFAETMIASLLSRSKTMTMERAIELYQEAMKPIRSMHDTLCEQFGIHPVTGQALLPK